MNAASYRATMKAEPTKRRRSYRSPREMNTYLALLLVSSAVLRFVLPPSWGDGWLWGLAVAYFALTSLGWFWWVRVGRAKFPLRKGARSGEWQTYTVQGREYKRLP